MKKALVFLIITTLAFDSIAQTKETNVSGKVVDEMNTPVSFANIVVKNSTDSAIVKVNVSDSDGKFSFDGISFGSYFIEASFVGFLTTISPVFHVSNAHNTVVLEHITLQEASINLANVVIKGSKPLVEQKADRMVINVEASVTNIGSTALEVLEKSPGVTVNKDGNISLKGKSEVMVMIDGKPSYLSSAELANLLASMSSNQLNQIEIMTNPSSKYDAAGNAGVINIITKKNMVQGFNGSVTLSYGQGQYAKSNNNLSLNYGTDKLNVFMNYGYSLSNSFMNFDVQRNFFGTEGAKIFELDQQADRISQSQNHNLKLGLDYSINKQTTLGLSTSGFFAPQNQDGLTTSNIIGADGSVNSILKTTSLVDNTWKNGAANLNFHYLSPDNTSEITSNLDYLYYDFSGNQNISNLTYDPDQVLTSSFYLNNILPLDIHIYSGRIDLSHQFNEGVSIETGVKSSLVNTDNVSDFFRLADNAWVPDSTLSSAFAYSENINAAYLSLLKKLDKWSLQGGVRLENTQYTGVQSARSQTTDSTFDRTYTRLFPTAYIGYEADENNQLILSLGRRIDRPEYQQLNPFIGFLDQYTYSTGNPYLQPQFSTNIELSHTYQNRFTTTLNYSVIHDMINEMFIQDDSLIIRTIGNIGQRYNYGISESAALSYGNWYSGMLFANLYQNQYDGVINGEVFRAKQLTLSLNINNQFSFSNGWSAELSGSYTGRNRDEGQAIILPAGQVSAGISKKLFHDNGSLKLSMRDIFYTQNPKEIQNFQDVQSTIRISRDTRVLTLAFIYRFGTISNARSESISPTDEQKRVKIF